MLDFWAGFFPYTLSNFCGMNFSLYRVNAEDFQRTISQPRLNLFSENFKYLNTSASSIFFLQKVWLTLVDRKRRSLFYIFRLTWIPTEYGSVCRDSRNAEPKIFMVVR